MTTTISSMSLGEQEVPTLAVEDALQAMVDDELRPWLQRMQLHWRVGVQAFVLLIGLMAMAAASVGGVLGLGTSLWLTVGTPIALLLAGLTVAARALIDDTSGIVEPPDDAVAIEPVPPCASCAGLQP